MEPPELIALRTLLLSQIAGNMSAVQPKVLSSVPSLLPDGTIQGSIGDPTRPELRNPLVGFPLPIWSLLFPPSTGLPLSMPGVPFISPLFYNNALTVGPNMAAGQPGLAFQFPHPPSFQSITPAPLQSAMPAIYPPPPPVSTHQQQQSPMVSRTPLVSAALTQRPPRRKRARILREGQLTMIVYGQQEAILWAQRVSLFQSTLRNVLGDRRRTFTWSGSVLDSVVGAFLTQNVSDALSSRAYMELAARWPSANSNQRFAKNGVCSDSVDWEAVRLAPTEEVADAIKCRGMHRKLSELIQACLSYVRMVNAARLACLPYTAADDDLVNVALVMSSILKEVEQDVDVYNDGRGNVLCVPSRTNNVLSPTQTDAQRDGAERARRRDHVSVEYETEKLFGHQPVPCEKLNMADHTSEGYTDVGDVGACELPMPFSLLSLEWLRCVSDKEAREFLMGVNGLGRKSVACIMLLTLGKQEFPVDTNVGRICSRLGWLPLDATAAIEDLDDYAPEPEVHAYLRSRLHSFDLETLYELHYQMITLGKVFCSKAQPNCKACPMQEHCEYALNNGPSLNGRKRDRTAATGPAIPSDTFHRDVADIGMGAFGSSRSDGKGVIRSQNGRSEPSQLALDELIASAPKRPRTWGTRRPIGSTESGEANQERTRMELQYQASVACGALRLRSMHRAPLLLMGETPEQHPSVWDDLLSATGPPETIAIDPACLDHGSLDLRGEEAAVLDTADVQNAPICRNSFAPTGNSVWDMMVACEVDDPLSPGSRLHEEKLVFDYQNNVSVGNAHIAQADDLIGETEVAHHVPLLLSKPATVEQHHEQASVLQTLACTSGQPMDTDPMLVTAKSQISPTMTPRKVMQTEIDPETAVENCVDLASPSKPQPPMTEATLCASCNLDQSTIAVPTPMGKPSLAAAKINAASECERLCMLGKELSALSEAMLCSSIDEEIENHAQRLLEVSLNVFGIDSMWHADSTATILSASRRRYIAIARAIHPDRCKVERASEAFAAAGRALAVVMERARALNNSELPDDVNEKTTNTCQDAHKDGNPEETAGSALMQQTEGETEMHHHITWTSSRLVVCAHVLPPDLHNTFPLQSAEYDMDCSGDENLFFLPLEMVPTLKDRVHQGITPMSSASRTGPRLPAAADMCSNETTVEELLHDMICSIESGSAVSMPFSRLQDESEHGDGRGVEGVLLVNCRAALRGRFPLNGTYFQTNEVFLDEDTVRQPIRLPHEVLKGTKRRAVYFGLGIHFMSKGMTREQVAHMFACGRCCFRAIDPGTKSPRLLPHFLMPSIPTKSNTPWKNAEERRKAAAAKAATRLQNPLLHTSVLGLTGAHFNPSPKTMLSALNVQTDIRIPRFHTNTASPGAQIANVGNNGSGIHSKGQAKTQTLADARSGKGRIRVNRYPSVRSSDRCGACKACLNPGWKKACEVRRAEMLALAVACQVEQDVDDVAIIQKFG